MDNQRKLPTGGPAFPCQALNRDNHMISYTGMTLRDFFASQAMIGLVQDTNDPFEVIATAAYEMADVMMNERAKR